MSIRNLLELGSLTKISGLVKLILSLLSISLVYSCSDKLKIISKPISFSTERINLTKEYLKNHYGINKGYIEFIPRMIILHWTAIDDFDSSFKVFNMEKLENSRPELSGAGEVNVSIHFLVDRDGSVYQLMPETKMARHAIGLNYVAIGVENVGGENNVDNLTDEQVEANIKLVRYLSNKYPSINYLAGHHEYREFENHPLWMEKDSTYRTIKYDPGERFMNEVRKGIADLNLKKAGG
jgi:beta-N-acetylhexosaminidase